MNLILRGGELYGSAPGDVYITDGRIAAEAAPDATVVDVDGARPWQRLAPRTGSTLHLARGVTEP